MGRTALLACPEGGTSLSAMAGLDRSSFNTEPGLRSISFSSFCFCAVCCCRQLFCCGNVKKRSPHRICAVTFLLLTRPLKMPAACALGIFSGIIILNCNPGKSADFPGLPFHAKGLAHSPPAPKMASSTVEAALYNEPAACSTCSCVGRLTAGVSVLPPSAGVVSG